MSASIQNEVDIKNEHPLFRFRQKKLIQVVQIILKALKYKNTYLSLVFVSDRQIKKLNRLYLRHPWVTDVIAFPSSQPQTRKHPAFLGEVIIAPSRAKNYAQKNKLSIHEELLRYICHGILHLHGLKDKSKQDQAKMRRMEDKLIALIPARLRTVLYGYLS